jgi:hypothetical protein
MAEKKLVVKALAGLANRMRVIESAVALSQEMDRPLEIIWNRESALNCRYEELFLPMEEFRVRNDWYDTPRTLFRPWESLSFILREKFSLNVSFAGHTWIYDRYPSILDGIDFAAFNKGKSIFISTAHRFRTARVIPRLQPIPELENRIMSLCGEFGDPTYGIHIRRGDSRLSKLRSPEMMFIRKMEELIENNPATQFFLATDDAGVRANLQRKFPGRIIINPHVIQRNTKEGIQNALIDMYCLSRTKMIFGSFYSSFSAVSAMITQIPFEVIQS